MQRVRTTPARNRPSAEACGFVELVAPSLEMTSTALNRLQDACSHSPDAETGGLLIGTRTSCVDIRTLPNATGGDRRTTYAVDPDDLHHVELSLGSRRSIGWWHSHVARSPRPSPGDVADAPWATFQVIVSLVARRSLRVSRWWVDDRGRWYDLGELRWR
jgi:proteasome lid subunit RPN8/RPN11